MSRNRWKVHLMGGDQTGWALDQDVATTRKALEALPDLIELTTLRDAEVVHSVWEEPLLQLNPSHLVGKRIVCHMCNDVLRTFEHAFMMKAFRTIGLWVGISRQAEEVLTGLKLLNAYIPYAIDTTVFNDSVPAGEVAALREQWGIPLDRYLVGNMMRDTSGADLMSTKPQKAAEVFCEVVTRLYRQGLPVHVLLAGPRRHWLRRMLSERNVPYTYVGRIIEGEDNDINILSQDEVSRLYHLMDVSVVVSRWEGGPRSILEAAATRTKVISTPVGLAPDVLDGKCLFECVDEGVQLLARDIREKWLDDTVKPQYERVTTQFCPQANVPRFRSLYERLADVPIFDTAAGIKSCRPPVRPSRLVQATTGIIRKTRNVLGLKPAAKGLRIGLWHEFHKPPYGGGNQFMMALKKALERASVSVVSNSTSSAIDVHLCNSAWFDVKRFGGGMGQRAPRIIHRVDGPIAIYRGSNWDEDNKIYDLNSKFASATVYQSGWCFRRMLELDFKPINPVVIRNAVDGNIFHRKGRIPYSRDRKLRLISTAWSDNPRKGGPFYKSLESRIDWNRFDYTFVGNTQQKFEKIRHIPPQNSEKLADILRQHDVYVMASQSEACSNALIEAMACGLPVIYLDDGGNRELVGAGGIAFRSEDEALAGLDRLAEMYESFQAGIWVESIEDIACRYLALAERVMAEYP